MKEMPQAGKLGHLRQAPFQLQAATVMTLANRINEKDIKQVPFYLKANK